MKKCVLLSVLLVLFFAVVSAEHLIIVTDEWFPYEYFDENGAHGLDVELVQLVAKKLGITVEFQKYSWNRCIDLVRRGEADAIISIVRTAEREEFLLFPQEPLTRYENILFQNISKKKKYKTSLSDIHGSTVGVMRGYSYEKSFDTAVDNKYVVAMIFDSHEAIIEAVKSEKIEFGIGNRVVITAYAGKNNVDSFIQIVEPPISSVKGYIAFSKVKHDRTDIVTRFEAMLKKVKKTPVYTTLKRNYGLE